ncbi:hypothetical protein, partial [Bacteroides nordii]|uniref:hypothetical protein n=1 Tax=Bacteroides nordii TaxID=291645 RepID=UPI001E43462C
WQKPGQQNVAQELIKIIINYVAELRLNKINTEKTIKQESQNIVYIDRSIPVYIRDRYGKKLCSLKADFFLNIF